MTGIGATRRGEDGKANQGVARGGGGRRQARNGEVTAAVFGVEARPRRAVFLHRVGASMCRARRRVVGVPHDVLVMSRRSGAEVAMTTACNSDGRRVR